MQPVSASRSTLQALRWRVSRLSTVQSLYYKQWSNLIKLNLPILNAIKFCQYQDQAERINLESSLEQFISINLNFFVLLIRALRGGRWSSGFAADSKCVRAIGVSERRMERCGVMKRWVASKWSGMFGILGHCYRQSYGDQTVRQWLQRIAKHSDHSNGRFLPGCLQ